MIDPTAKIHESAYVDEPASVGPRTMIWHGSHVREHAVIGRDCNIGMGVYVGRGVSIGDRCKIQNQVSVYEEVTLQDEVFCGPGCVFTNVINPRAAIERKDEFQPTLVKRGATIGANATILCGVTLGRWCLIGAGALVRQSVPDFAVMVGSPATFLGWATISGHRIGSLLVGEDFEDPNDGLRYRLKSVRNLELISEIPPVK